MTTNAPLRLLTLGALFILSGCATTDVARIGHQVYPPTNPKQVEVFHKATGVLRHCFACDIGRSTAAIHRPYQLIARITASNYAFPDDFIQALKKKAATLGANAILITQIIQPSPLEALSGPHLRNHITYNALAIRFTGPVRGERTLKTSPKD